MCAEVSNERSAHEKKKRLQRPNPMRNRDQDELNDECSGIAEAHNLWNGVRVAK